MTRNVQLKNAYQRLLMTKRRLAQLEANGNGTALQHGRLLQLLEKQTREHQELKANLRQGKS